MTPYFYLSCSAADDSKLLRAFFESLSAAVRSQLQLSADEEVGFFDPTASTNGKDWRPEVKEALRTSLTMVALVSPNYFQNQHAGKEWQLFETRRKSEDGSVDAARLSTSAIVPVIWIPCDDPPAKVIEQAQFGWNESPKIYRLHGLLSLMSLRGSLPSLGDEYEKVLGAVAKQIVDLARTVKLPALDAVPSWSEVKSAFKEEFKAAIVEDNQDVRELLVKYLSTRGYDCKEYPEAESALDEILACPHQAGPFDVVLIDLELENKKLQGLKLIERLTVDENSPPIIAMSAGLTNSEYIQALRAGAKEVVSKPFALVQTEKRIRKIARIGQKSRLQRKKVSKTVYTRKRPVFLSYSGLDWRTANALRTQMEACGIGVWYAPDNLDPGNWLTKLISNGLEDAQVFVALVTDNYARSPWCVFELTTCQRKPTKVVIPVLEGYVHRMRNAELIREITTSVCDITFDRFADGLTLLLGKIQLAIKARKASP